MMKDNLNSLCTTSDWVLCRPLLVEEDDSGIRRREPSGLVFGALVKQAGVFAGEVSVVLHECAS